MIADGAAFGAEMNRIMNLQRHHPNITVCLPESFEWLILRSGLIRTDDLNAVLENPSDFIEASEFFSWEQFFTDYLIRNTKDTYYSYNKSRLNSFYVVKANMNKVAALIGISKDEG